MKTADELREVYQARFQERGAALARWTRWDRRVADARLLVFLTALVTGWLVYGSAGLSGWWLVLAVAVFFVLVIVHDPIARAGDRARRAVDFYARGIARLEGRWAGAGTSGLDHLDLEHPYAADLDLFGAGSLFERLCTARTRAGELALASWLLAPAQREAIIERQASVDEMRPRLDLREDLELLGGEVRAGLDPAALIAWCDVPRVFGGRALPIAALLLALAATGLVVGWLFFDVPAFPMLIVLLIEAALAGSVARRTRSVLADIDERTHDLVLLSELLGRLEREPFETPLLRRLRGVLETGGLPASTRIRRLARLLGLLDHRRNQLFAPFAAIWLWTTQLAIRIDAWRGTVGPEVAHWIDAVGAFEALGALGAYAAENPADPFPELIDETSDGDAEGDGDSAGPALCAVFQAEGLGHPLIPEPHCVRNDVTLGGGRAGRGAGNGDETSGAEGPRVLIVSGSNMSGKSTLLRSVGANAVLALAGAPVRARRLRISMLAIGATLRVQDSLQAGRSRFYAEITRVKQVVELASGSPPLLFLFDELFHGTNSHDRRIGAESVVRGLIERGAIGLLTTHDLELTRVVERLAPRVRNVHFEDRLIDGVMHFDYRIRQGVVEHSNALALMRAVGLDV